MTGGVNEGESGRAWSARAAEESNGQAKAGCSQPVEMLLGEQTLGGKRVALLSEAIKCSNSGRPPRIDSNFPQSSPLRP